MKIKQLSELKIKQIAAGEVIANVFNAIKEIIENAIDAKSDEISIHIKQSGLEQIIITDNGHGMDEVDLKLCTQMHTTSKTNEEDQFFGAHSLGFRGEALASIDVVCDLSIESNGKKIEKNIITPSTLLHGTKIEIKNLFAKAPARLKFIKHQSELNKIKSIIKQYAACYENITFSFFNNEKKVWHFLKTSKEKRLKQIWKCEDITNFEQETKNSKIKCFISKTKLNEEFIFINNRPVKDKAISAYLRSVFSEYYMKHEFPSFALFISVDPLLCDFNVHPTKLEVKLLSYSEIFAVIGSNFSQEFLKKTLSAESHIEFESNFIPTPKITPQIKPTFHSTENLNLIEENNEVNFDQIEPIYFEENKKENFKIIGQVKNTYILFETESGIGVFDQHAVHERKVYEQMKKELVKENMQKLLFPIKLNLNEVQKDFIKKNITNFENKGIKIENYQITHLPNIISSIQSDYFIDFFEEHSDCNTVCDRILANIACKNALKANTKLSVEQMQSLLEDALTNIPVCNHGRPSFQYFSLNEIEAWFKRR